MGRLGCGSYGVLFFFSRASRISATIVGIPSTIKKIVRYSISIRAPGCGRADVRSPLFRRGLRVPTRSRVERGSSIPGTRLTGGRRLCIVLRCIQSDGTGRGENRQEALWRKESEGCGSRFAVTVASWRESVAAPDAEPPPEQRPHLMLCSFLYSAQWSLR